MRQTLALLTVSVCLFALPLSAAERGVKRVETYATADRHALVIGNSAYTQTSPLRNSINDAWRLLIPLIHTVDVECEGGFPGQRSVKVEIDTTDGRTVSYFSPTRKGDPDHPLTDEELNEKYAELAVPVIGETAAQTLAERLWAVEELPTLKMLGLEQLRPLETA